MITATIDILRKKGFSKIGILDLDRSCPFSFSRQADITLDLSGYLPAWGYPGEFDFFEKLHDYDYFLVVGADVLDGHYSDRESYRRLLLAYWANLYGLKTTLLGFSYNETPGEKALRILKQLDMNIRICARDPTSYRRLTAHIGRPLIQTADIAFLLESKEPIDVDLKRWISEAKKQRKPIYGINAISTSKFFTNKDADFENAYIDFYVAMVQAIAEHQPNSCFIFISHDYRPNGIGEGPLLGHILGLLPAALQARILLLNNSYTVEELKWIAGQLDFIVSSRMHLAIAAIGQGTPVFCFEYQSKFQGLFELIGMPELAASMETTQSNPQALIKLILNHMNRSSIIRERLVNKLPEIRALAEKNFDI